MYRGSRWEGGCPSGCIKSGYTGMVAWKAGAWVDICNVGAQVALVLVCKDVPG